MAEENTGLIAKGTALTFKYGELNDLTDSQNGALVTSNFKEGLKTGDIFIAKHSNSIAGSLIVKTAQNLLPITIMPGADGAVLIGQGVGCAPIYSYEVKYLGFGCEPLSDSSGKKYGITTVDKTLFQNDLIFQIKTKDESGNIIFKYDNDDLLTIGFTDDKTGALVSAKKITLNFNSHPTSATQSIAAKINPNTFYSGSYSNTTTKQTADYCVDLSQFNYNFKTYLSTNLSTIDENYTISLSSAGFNVELNNNGVGENSFSISKDNGIEFQTTGKIKFNETSQIIRNFIPSSGISSWWQGRDKAMIRLNSNGSTKYAPILSVDAADYSWEMGTCAGEASHKNKLIFTWIPDSNYMNKSNPTDINSRHIKFAENGVVEAQSFCAVNYGSADPELGNKVVEGSDGKIQAGTVYFRIIA